MPYLFLAVLETESQIDMSCLDPDIIPTLTTLPSVWFDAGLPKLRYPMAPIAMMAAPPISQFFVLLIIDSPNNIFILEIG